MQIDFRFQLLLALYSFPAGVLLGALHDIFRVIRLPFGKIGVFVTDTLQVLVCFFTVQVLLFNFNSGKIRFYPFVFCFIGLVLYRTTVGRLFTAVAVKLASYISPLIKLALLAVKGYILKKRLLRAATGGLGIRFIGRDRRDKENTT